jgi:hypothetical protein
MKHKKLSKLLSCVNVENYHFLNGILDGLTFLSNLPCLDPRFWGKKKQTTS